MGKDQVSFVFRLLGQMSTRSTLGKLAGLKKNKTKWSRLIICSSLLLWMVIISWAEPKCLRMLDLSWSNVHCSLIIGCDEAVIIFQGDKVRPQQIVNPINMWFVVLLLCVLHVKQCLGPLQETRDAVQRTLARSHMSLA